MNVNSWKVLLLQQFSQSNASLDWFDKDYNLIEFKRIQKIEQFSIFLRFAQFHIVLL